MTEKIARLAEDQETIINYSRYIIGEWPELYTTDKAVMKRYEKFMEKHPDKCKLVSEDKYSMTFSVDPKCASLYPRAPRQMKYTEEQKLALAERLKASRKTNP